MPSNSLLDVFLGWLYRPDPQTRPQPQPYQTASRPAPNAPAAPPQPQRQPYGRIDRLLTISEGDFYAVLRAALPAGHLLFAQVRLASLIRVQPWAQRDKRHWYRIQAKCVDFVVCDAHTFAPRLVVELDDASHDRADRQARDVFVDEVLAGVGLPILHVRWQRSYSQAALAGQVRAALGLQAAMPAQAAPILAASSSPAPAAIAAQRHTCGQCQAELRPGARFCPQCGATFTPSK